MSPCIGNGLGNPMPPTNHQRSLASRKRLDQSDASTHQDVRRETTNCRSVENYTEEIVENHTLRDSFSRSASGHEIDLLVEFTAIPALSREYDTLYKKKLYYPFYEIALEIFQALCRSEECHFV